MPGQRSQKAQADAQQKERSAEPDDEGVTAGDNIETAGQPSSDSGIGGAERPGTGEQGLSRAELERLRGKLRAKFHR